MIYLSDHLQCEFLIAMYVLVDTVYLNDKDWHELMDFYILLMVYHKLLEIFQQIVLNEDVLLMGK